MRRHPADDPSRASRPDADGPLRRTSPGDRGAPAGPARAGERPARTGERPARTGERPVRAGDRPVRVVRGSAPRTADPTHPDLTHPASRPVRVVGGPVRVVGGPVRVVGGPGRAEGDRVRVAAPQTRAGGGPARSSHGSARPSGDGPRPARATGTSAGRSPSRAPSRAPSRPVRLRLTPRGLAVLGTGAALVVTLLVVAVVGLVRLVAGPAAHAQAEALAPAAVCQPDVVSSLNCWPAIDDGADPRLEPSSWITGRVLAGDVHTVLDHVAARFDALVEPVDVASSWGWSYREVRGDVSLSNHASGTSIDLNAPEHPLGATDTFTPAQVEAIRGILAEVAPVVGWGGDFDGRVDEMHFEIAGDATAVAEVAARLRGTSAG